MSTPVHLKSHRDMALEALEDAGHFRTMREDERGPAGSKGALIASYNDRIGYGLAVAKVHAHLAIAEAISNALPKPAATLPEHLHPLTATELERIQHMVDLLP